MTEKLIAPWLAWPETKALVKAFAGQPLRFVGGAVRDAILGRPVQDVDAATPLLPEEVTELLSKSNIKVIPTGIDHGTVTAVIGKRHFEITTLRRDISTDGRRATVAYTKDWREDAERRDFTMNAISSDENGNVTDYFGGAGDAKTGHVRFIGEAAARIEEDALRILRFFRFFAHYGRDPVDIEGLTACTRMAGKIDNLSGERIQQEMLKLLVAERASDVVDMMQQNEIWHYVVPVQVKTDALKRLPQALKKAESEAQPILALALLIRSAEQDKKAVAESINGRWKLSKAHHRQLDALCKPYLGAEDLGNEKSLKKKIRALGKALFIEHVILLMAEGADEKKGYAAIALARRWEVPQFPLSGNDLQMRGIKPGKEMGVLLKRLEEEWEEGGYAASKETLLKSAISARH